MLNNREFVFGLPNSSGFEMNRITTLNAWSMNGELIDLVVTGNARGERNILVSGGGMKQIFGTRFWFQFGRRWTSQIWFVNSDTKRGVQNKNILIHFDWSECGSQVTRTSELRPYTVHTPTHIRKRIPSVFLARFTFCYSISWLCEEIEDLIKANYSVFVRLAFRVLAALAQLTCLFLTWRLQTLIMIK